MSPSHVKALGLIAAALLCRCSPDFVAGPFDQTSADATEFEPADAGPEDPGDPADSGLPGDGETADDAGPSDGGTRDGSAVDAAIPNDGKDGGRIDSGAPDAGFADAALPDAGPPDAGPPDAGPPDAGPGDAGPADAGRADAGTADAGGTVPLSPLALIYSGTGSCDGCHQAIAQALKKDSRGWRILYVLPEDLTPSLLAEATLYVQPGGDGSVEALDAAIGSARGQAIVDYVRNGGHYLGVCMGGFYASSYGIGLLAGGTPTWNDAKSGTFVRVQWGAQERQLYYEGGFYVPTSLVTSSGASVVATYKDDGTVAAVVAKVGAGGVGICGPHPEGSSWGSDPDGDDTSLLLDLLDSTLAL